MRYQVILKKYEIYEIEADDAWEAEDKAVELCETDPYAWQDDIDEVYIEEMP